MRIIIAVLMLAFTASAVQALPKGNPFLKGISSPSELASKIESSLARDPTGQSIIDPTRCKRDGSCAKPIDYLITLREADPAARLTSVAAVPEFLRELKIVPAPAGEYWIACLKPIGKGAHKPVLHCLSRFFKPGEKAWINAKTNRVIFASNCTNPVEKPVPPKPACAYIPFITKEGDTVVRFAIQGPAPVNDACIAVKRAGEEDYERWWADECASIYCDFSENARYMGQPVQLIGSYVPKPGEHVLRVPAKFAEPGSRYMVALCLERTNMAWPQYDASTATRAEWEAYVAQRGEWIALHSDTMNVMWYGYRMNSVGLKEARVYYTRLEVPSDAPVIYWPWHEFARVHPASAPHY